MNLCMFDSGTSLSCITVTTTTTATRYLYLITWARQTLDENSRFSLQVGLCYAEVDNNWRLSAAELKECLNEAGKPWQVLRMHVKFVGTEADRMFCEKMLTIKRQTSVQPENQKQQVIVGSWCFVECAFLLNGIVLVFTVLLTDVYD